MNNSNRYAVILCGGSGTRLWPLSRTLRPKQLLAINGDKTLFEQTVKRVSQHIDPRNLYAVTHEDHKFEVKGQLTEFLSKSVENVLAEPFAKNTLPAVAWATCQIYKQNPDALIAVFASDHAIDNEDAFICAWETAEQVAKKDYLVLLGITPNFPATGYGYIKPSESLGFNGLAYQVAKFVEKPDSEGASQLIGDGCLWNSGMFVFKADSFMRLLEQYQPDISQKILALAPENLTETYSQIPNLSIDYGLSEPLARASEKIAVVPVAMGWSDLGSWNAIHASHPKDQNNNATHGEVLSIDTQNSLLWSEAGLVATLGLSNIAVIQASDATLICDRSRVEDIKDLVAAVKVRKPSLTETHPTVFRPWGSYTVLEEHANFKIKRIAVNPRAKISMQMHHHRSEHWVVVCGIATVSNNGIESKLYENESIYVPKMSKHRLINSTNKTLVIIEVQCGEHVNEDDIVRFDDDYGRALSSEQKY